MNTTWSHCNRALTPPSPVDRHHAPHALPPSFDNLHYELVLRIRSEIIEHYVEIRGVAVLMAGFVGTKALGCRVPYDVVPVLYGEQYTENV